MTRSRWPVVVVLAVAVAALLLWWPGREGERPTEVLRSPVPASVGDGGASWYCAAPDPGGEAAHTVVVSAVADESAEVRLDSFGAEGRGESAEITVQAGTTRSVDVASTLGVAAQSVMLEASSPVVVEHRFVTDSGADQAPCSTFSSDLWYFPAVATTKDASARLALFNPFPGDATVDVELAFETGVRVPTALSGIVVPAGVTKVVDLAEVAERREQFSATVRSRTGVVVAELTQTFDGSNEDRPIKGLRLVPGARSAAARWSFAGGFADGSASERVIVLNPSDDPVRVLVQVVPYGGTDALPEPFQLDVPGLRYGVIDLSQESRVAPNVDHSIEVEAQDGAEVVAARSIDVNGSIDGGTAMPLRSLMETGTTASPGSVAAVRRWVSAGLQRDSAADAAMLVHNPGPGIAVVEVTAVDAATGERGTPVALEIAEGDAAVVSAESMAPPSATFSAEVVAESPVVVERLYVFSEPSDISMQTSVPVVGSLEQLERLDA